MDFSTFEISMWSLGNKLFAAAMGLCLLGMMSKVYDRSADVNTQSVFDLIERDANAAARYKGAERIAFAIIIGWCLS